MKFPTDWSMYGFCRQNLGQGFYLASENQDGHYKNMMKHFF